MKRFLTLLFITINGSVSSAQVKPDSLKHLSFKGVPIDGTLTLFVSKMKKSGFIQKGTKDGVSILEGDFASYKNCTVGIVTLKQKDLVSRIAVRFTDRDTWSSLSSNYFNLKQLLTEKYGEPSECVEKFESYSPDDDGSKMSTVQLGACKYYAIYEMTNGSIELSIEHDGTTRCYIKLAYFDKINSETVKKQALDDL